MTLEDFLNYDFTAIDKKDVKSYAKCFWEAKDTTHFVRSFKWSY